MTDRAKVIKGLELCKERRRDCNECPYNDETLSCQDALMWDALELLKEQAEHIDRLERDLAITTNNLNYYINEND